MHPISIPFEYDDDSTYGMRVVFGHLKYDGKSEALHLEYSTKDALVGVIKSEVQDLLIPFSEINTLESKKKFFSRKLIIRCHSLRTLQHIPGVKGSTLELKVKKEDFNKAQQLVSTVLLLISEQRLRDMNMDE